MSRRASRRAPGRARPPSHDAGCDGVLSDGRSTDEPVPGLWGLLGVLEHVIFRAMDGDPPTPSGIKGLISWGSAGPVGRSTLLAPLAVLEESLLDMCEAIGRPTDGGRRGILEGILQEMDGPTSTACQIDLADAPQPARGGDAWMRARRWVQQALSGAVGLAAIPQGGARRRVALCWLGTFPARQVRSLQASAEMSVIAIELIKASLSETERGEV